MVKYFMLGKAVSYNLLYLHLLELFEVEYFDVIMSTDIKTKLNDEFQIKKSTLENELQAEAQKFTQVQKYYEQAGKELSRFLSQSEKVTVDSINKEIDYYNKLATAISNAKTGKTSGKAVYQNINRELELLTNKYGVAPITINITGNTLLDNQAGEKLGNSIIDKLKTNIRF